MVRQDNEHRISIRFVIPFVPFCLLFTVFSGGNHVVPSVAYNMVLLIAEGATAGENEEQDNQLREFAVDSYFTLIENPTYPVDSFSDLLKRVIAWLLGEYRYQPRLHLPRRLLT